MALFSARASGLSSNAIGTGGGCDMPVRRGCEWVGPNVGVMGETGGRKGDGDRDFD